MINKKMTQEEISIKHVVLYERKQGRKAVDVSKKHIGYDVKSGNRYIEVKSRPGATLQNAVILHNALLRKLGKGLARYYIYIVYDMKKKPKLIVIPPEIVFMNLETKVNLLIRKKVYNKLKTVSLV